ncbi:hypothetical protein HYY75_04535 [bacterium]|nr:hypothetical protein [bacterium]
MLGEIKCPQCGFQIISGQKLCRNCGSRLLENSSSESRTHESVEIHALAAEPAKPANLEKASPNLKQTRSEVNPPPPNFDQAFYLREPPQPIAKKGPEFTFLELMIVIAIILICAAMAIPNFKKCYRQQSREKACYANMRVILGAIEMYNMDYSAQQKTMNPNVEGLLVSGGYLKNHIPKPDMNCEYGATEDLTASGVIICKVHGTVQ